MKTKEIRIRTFGQIAEIVSQISFIIDVDGTTDDLKMAVASKFPAMANIPFAIAVNKKLVVEPIAIAETDEVALLPPFSGG